MNLPQYITSAAIAREFIRPDDTATTAAEAARDALATAIHRLNSTGRNLVEAGAIEAGRRAYALADELEAFERELMDAIIEAEEFQRPATGGF